MCLWFIRSSRPGGDLLSHTLRCSTIGAEGFHGRVRDGIGCRPLAITTRSWRPDEPHVCHRDSDCPGGTWARCLTCALCAPEDRSSGECCLYLGLSRMIGLDACSDDLIGGSPSKAVLPGFTCPEGEMKKEGSIKPIERLVLVSFIRYRTSTSSLSTWWSTTVLSETWFRGGLPA